MTDVSQSSSPSLYAMRNLSWTDCHGGASLTTPSAGAKSLKAGFIGVPNQTDISILGTGYRANVANLCRCYLPVNQFAKYLARLCSVRLPARDKILAFGYNCHSDHHLLKANVPASCVRPSHGLGMSVICYAGKVLAPYEMIINPKTSDICHRLLGTIVTSMQ